MAARGDRVEARGVERRASGPQARRLRREVERRVVRIICACVVARMVARLGPARVFRVADVVLTLCTSFTSELMSDER